MLQRAGNASAPYYRDEWKDWGDATISRGKGTTVGEQMIASGRSQSWLP
eukprot:SAG31_NODE_21252_length_554_cov_0.786813_1_plen_48_part_10